MGWYFKEWRWQFGAGRVMGDGYLRAALYATERTWWFRGNRNLPEWQR